MKKLILLLVLTVTSLSAISQVTSIINITITPITTIQVTGTSTMGSFTDATSIEQGLISTPVTIGVMSNQPWKITTDITNIAATQLVGTVVTPVTTGLLVPSKIQWSVTPTDGGAYSNFLPFPTLNSNTEVRIGDRGAPTKLGNTFQLRYKIVPGYETQPADYVIYVTYTVTPR